VPCRRIDEHEIEVGQVSAFGTRSGEAEDTAPSPEKKPRHGPASPNCSQADEAPSPPLNRNVTGLVPRSAPSSW
jgi:hypothetical protein